MEIPAPVNLKIYAGNCAFEYSSVTADILSGNIPEPEGLWDKSAAEIVSMINAGWNLGNTLDSWGEWIDLYTDRTPERYETAWGNPVTSKAMIDGVKAGGFDLIRIPVTWAQHIDPDTYRIDPVWMARVREVVDYAIDENTFVILNTHHEDNWINVDGSMSVETMSAELTAVWTQIANEFADYDQHLIFEVMNETRDIGSDDEWSGNAASYERVNQLGAAALAAIRATGGKNATDRCVMLPTYAASSSPAPMNALTIPSGDSHVIVSIHAYTPYNFAVDHESPYNLSIQSQLDTLFNNISAMQAAKNNVPVIIGEFGCYVKTDGTSRNSWASYYLSKARSLGYPCVVWDNGGNNEYQIFNRNTLTWDDPAYVSILTGNN